MTDKSQTMYVTRVDPLLLRKYPQLGKIPSRISSEQLNGFISALEARAEGMKAEVASGMLLIAERASAPLRRYDYLGLVKPDPKLAEICEVIGEDTGRDPRREAIYSKRGSAFEGLSDDARINQTNGKPGGKRERHPLDPVSSEEIVQRREAADARWSRAKRYHRPRKGN